MDKKTKDKILEKAGTVFAGYCEDYEKIILQFIIDHPNITAEELAFVHFGKYRGVQRYPIKNVGLAQRFIDLVEQTNKFK